MNLIVCMHLREEPFETRPAIKLAESQTPTRSSRLHQTDGLLSLTWPPSRGRITNCNYRSGPWTVREDWSAGNYRLLAAKLINCQLPSFMVNR